MTDREFNQLEIGDIVRHEADGEAYVVVGRSEHRVVVSKTLVISNPPEWRKVDRDHRVIGSQPDREM